MLLLAMAMEMGQMMRRIVESGRWDVATMFRMQMGEDVYWRLLRFVDVESIV